MALSENARGALFMSIAMAAFTCNDALVKSVTAELSIAQIMAVRGIMTMMLVYAAARTVSTLGSWRVMLHPLVLLRGTFEIGATLTFLSALASIEFANASSILQSLPLAVTLGAALFFGEPVGWRRWTAIAVGFLGVLLILKPGPEGFAPGSLYAVGAVFFTAARDLTTRRMSADIPTLSVTLFTTLANTIIGTLLIWPMGGWQPLSAGTFTSLLIASVAVFVGYQSVIMSMRGGEISFVAPFRYTSLVWALIIGILFFGEAPDLFMLLGAATVIGSGLYTFYREAKRRTVTAAEASPVSPSA